MSIPKQFRVADFGGQIDEIQNAAGKTLFKEVSLDWSDPQLWERDADAPTGLHEEEPGYLYIITRDHHRAKTREPIIYVGITNNLKRRFLNHPKAQEISRKRGSTYLSIGTPDFGRYRTAITHNRRALEELEHLLIWTLWPTLLNERKQYTLPGMGKHPGRPWRIVNTGHPFAGRMPKEIVYPWMLIKPRRDRSAKPA